MAGEAPEREGFASPAPLLRPASVAIVGASERAKWPTQIYKNLLAFGYAGRIFPVNPRNAEVWGVRCYPDLASLPEAPQHALVIVPAPAVQGVLEIGVGAGLQSATVYASQIGEGADAETVARGRALKRLVERSGLALSGPNCMGGNSLREKFFGYPSSDLCAMEPGSTAVVTQSGGTLYYFAKAGTQRGLKFSYMVSSGNEIGLDLADYVNYFAHDPNTRVIALFIEGVRRPKAFMAAAAKALKARKPIIAIKTGRSQRSREAAQSHTGAIAGDYDVFAAMCERYGIVNCASLEDMIEAMLALQTDRLAKGQRVGWVTTSGGTVDLLFDYIEEIGGVEAPAYAPQTAVALQAIISPDLEVKNPLDAGDPPNDQGSAAMCAAAAADPNVDIVAWAATNYRGEGRRDPAPFRAVLDATDKPFVAFTRLNMALEKKTLDFQEDVGFPVLQGLPATVRALGALAFYGARAGRDAQTPRAPRGDGRAAASEALTAELGRAGLPAPRSAFAATPREAAAAAAAIGFPVALKIVSPDLSHKTDVGGVRLNLRAASEVEAQAEALLAAVAARAPTARIAGVLIQEMIAGTEVLLGARDDPQYGPMIVVGSGGVFVETLRDIAIRLLPVGPDDARAMLGTLKLAKTLSGFRGGPPADLEALTRAICGLGEFYLDRRDVYADLEINPLVVFEQGKGVCAVDVRAALRRS